MRKSAIALSIVVVGLLTFVGFLASGANATAGAETHVTADTSSMANLQIGPTPVPTPGPPPPSADLSISKSDDVDPVLAGETLI